MIVRRPTNEPSNGYWDIGNGTTYLVGQGGPNTAQPGRWEYITAQFAGVSGDSVLRVSGSEVGRGALPDLAPTSVTVGGPFVLPVKGIVPDGGVAAVVCAGEVVDQDKVLEVEQYIQDKYSPLFQEGPG